MPGVKAVKSHIVWIEPMSGMTFAIRTTAMGGHVTGTSAPPNQPSDKKLAAG